MLTRAVVTHFTPAVRAALGVTQTIPSNPFIPLLSSNPNSSVVGDPVASLQERHHAGQIGSILSRRIVARKTLDLR